MVWNAVFPLGTTQINQSVQQFQDNWAFLQTNINTDHFFNTGAPTEGHHRQVYTNNQGADPALAGMDAVIYTKAVGTSPATVPFIRTASGALPIPNYSNLTVVYAGPGTAPILTFLGLVHGQGLIYFSDINNSANRALCFYSYDGVNGNISPIVVTAGISAITVLANVVSLTVNGAMTVTASTSQFVI